jgi:acetyl esterase
MTSAAGEEYTVVRDVEFSRPAGVSIKLDAHVPPGKGPFPTVILVHGGGWTAGSKTAAFVQPLFEPLTQGGFAWFTIDYRLAPQYPYTAQVEDVEAAVRFVKANARQYKADPRRIALMGESAGGHLVNLVGVRNDVGVAAVVCFYGPIDMVQWAKVLEGKPLTKSIQGVFQIQELDAAGLAKIRASSPAVYLSHKTPPFLFIHGTKDEAVPYSQALLALELFKKAGVPSELITVDDGIHGVINWEKEARFTGYKAPMIAWLHRVLH